MAAADLLLILFLCIVSSVATASTLTSAVIVPVQSNSKISTITLTTKQSLKELKRSLLAMGFIPANIILKEIKAPALDKLPSAFFSVLTAPQMRDLMEAYVMAKQSSRGEEGLGPFHRALQKALEDRTIREDVTGEDLKRLGFHTAYVPVRKLTRAQLQTLIKDWSGERTLTQRVQNELEHFPVTDFVQNGEFEKCKLPERFLRKLAYVQPPVGWPRPLQQRAERLGLDITKLQLDSGIVLDADQNTLQNLQVYERNVLQSKNVRLAKKPKGEKGEKKEKKERRKKNKSENEGSGRSDSTSDAVSSSSPSTSTSSSSSSSSEAEEKDKKRRKHRRKVESASTSSESDSSAAGRPRKGKGRRKGKPRANQPGGRTVLGRIRSITIEDSDD